MKKFAVILILIITCTAVLYSCTQGSENKMENTYEQITPAEAKEIMDSQDSYVILDVRTQEEFDEAHIDGAILIPDYEISDKAESILKDKDQLILVYCRSGRRSKLAASDLVTLGYTNVKEFGGIIDWPYETV
ncbi:MAG: rhodanese-like domain-containing protein [Clostridia bacterium]|nr:rhodanese-like domain-containing protein [Clostridia bacterium]